MAVTLVGTVVNDCDSVTGFVTGNISGDDDFVQGTGSIGLKASATTTGLYTTAITGGPYSFASGGGQFGYHIICWFNTKTPIDPTTGLTIIVGNGTSRGRWNVLGSSFYKGGFVTRVINTAASFDIIAAGSWTLGGNPAQLTGITQVGGGFTTTTSIMGSFNNVQVDQFTIGLGVRVDAGTVGTPNKFETLRAQDEGISKWGWWSSANGKIIAKGKAYIGPATGTAVSVFNDTNFAVIFANERVATGFYDINTRGANTDVTWTLGDISASLATAARWSLTIQSDTKSFTDNNSKFTGADIITLNAASVLNGTVMVNCNSVLNNGASLNNITVISPSGTSAVTVADLAKINACTFTKGTTTNHAVRLTSIGGGSMTWTGKLTGYVAGVSGSPVTPTSTGNEAIFVDVGSGTLTINVATGATIPSIRSSGAIVNVVSSFTLTLTDVPSGVQVTIVNSSTRAELQNTVSTGANITYNHSGGATVDILFMSNTYDPNSSDIFDLTLPTTDSSIKISMTSDLNYSNPT